MSKTKKLLAKVALFSVAGVLVLLLCATYYVENQVQGVCKTATRLYPGDKVDAVILLAQRDAMCTKEKARALWALGQLGDRKALAFLRSNYGNRTEDTICNYEAKFAIKKLEEGRFNLPGFLWRKLLSE